MLTRSRRHDSFFSKGIREAQLTVTSAAFDFYGHYIDAESYFPPFCYDYPDLIDRLYIYQHNRHENHLLRIFEQRAINNQRQYKAALAYGKDFYQSLKKGRYLETYEGFFNAFFHLIVFAQESTRIDEEKKWMLVNYLYRIFRLTCPCRMRDASQRVFETEVHQSARMLCLRGYLATRTMKFEGTAARYYLAALIEAVNEENIGEEAQLAAVHAACDFPVLQTRVESLCRLLVMSGIQDRARLAALEAAGRILKTPNVPFDLVEKILQVVPILTTRVPVQSPGIADHSYRLLIGIVGDRSLPLELRKRCVDRLVDWAYSRDCLEQYAKEEICSFLLQQIQGSESREVRIFLFDTFKTRRIDEIFDLLSNLAPPRLSDGEESETSYSIDDPSSSSEFRSLLNGFEGDHMTSSEEES